MFTRLVILGGLFFCLSGTVFSAMDIKADYPAVAPHVAGKTVYPQYVLGMDRAEGWWFGGARNGNSGGVRLVDAPERPGRKALELFFTANKAAPEWFEWRYELNPKLSVFGSRELVFDLYPVDELTMEITARFGSQSGQSVLPICWHSIGKHRPGKWVEVRLPIMTQRFIDNLKFDLHNQADGILNGKPVRFIIDNIRFEPAPRDVAEVPIIAMETQPPVEAVYLELPKGTMIKDTQPLTLHLEISSLKAQPALLRVMNWKKKIEIKVPNTVLDISIGDACEQLGMGEFPLDVELTTESGRQLAKTQTPPSISTFSTARMEGRRQELLKKQKDLQARAEKLAGIEETMVSLTVARIFLEKYIPDDFTNQGAFKIAMKELEDIQGILNRAEKELDNPAKSDPLADYDPTRPVVIQEGNFTQNGRPILFVGPMAWNNTLDAVEWAKPLGFNSVVMDVGLKDWYGGKTQGPEYTKTILEMGKKAGIAVNFQLASHDQPKLVGPDASAQGDDADGNPGLPWNILQPAARKVLGDWYNAMLPPFAGYPNLMNLGMANEPTYRVGPGSKSFQAGFQRWANKQYKTITAANIRWGSSYGSFEAIDLPSFFKLRGKSKAAAYDWSEFEAQTMGDFFGFLARRIQRPLPEVSVSVKLVGGFGYDYLDEQEILFRGGQTVHGTDGAWPMFLDYLKSLDPRRPVFDGEWHMIFSEKAGNDPAYLGRVMFLHVLHGLAAGHIWQWHRFEWNSQIHGAEGSITRYPLGLEGMGRTSIKLRRLYPVLSQFANLDGGRVRLLYSKASHLHQSATEERVLPGVKLLVRVPAYLKGLEKTYQELSRNTSGVRFVIPETLKADDLKRVSLLAAGSGDYIQSLTLRAIEAWVGRGGTLWLTAPGLRFDPWGQKHEGIAVEFTNFLSTAGEHRYKNGWVVVKEDWAGVEGFLDGPKVMTSGKVNSQVECRLAVGPDGKFKYLSLINPGDQDQKITLSPAQGWVGRDIWNGGEVDLTKDIPLPGNGVILVEVKR